MQNAPVEVTTFDSTSEALNSLLGRIKTGQIQLPDFQRGWVWDDDHIKSLIVSIGRSFPIGAVMLLQTGNPLVRFRARSIETVKLPEGTEPELLILDGQQRLTSLYQVLFSGEVVKTKDSRGYELERFYYLNIQKIINGQDWDEAVISVPKTKQVKNFRNEIVLDLSTPEKEIEQELFPISVLSNPASKDGWMVKYLGFDQASIPARLEKWTAFNAILLRIQQYQLPIITLRKSNSKEAVCLVFEKVNQGGVSLNMFELLTASLASEDFQLREDWSAREKRIHSVSVLSNVGSTEFLQAITLLAAHAKGGPISCKRKDVLELTKDDYVKWAEKATIATVEVSKFLFNQKIFSSKELPYSTQLTPLIAAFTLLGSKVEVASANEKIARWYWCGVFGELYGGAIDTRIAKDFAELVKWIEGGTELPSSIVDANFAADRIDRLYNRRSAAYKGLLALLIHDGCRDFRTGTTIDQTNYFSEYVDIHHIFPKAWCTKHGIESKVYDSAVNKTPLTYRTNRILGGRAPSVYLNTLVKSEDVNPDQLRTYLVSHVIDHDLLAADDFHGFYQKRKTELLRRIERAMGKTILPEQQPETADLATDFQPDDSPVLEETVLAEAQ